jgi:hypothetical protein
MGAFATSAWLAIPVLEELLVLVQSVGMDHIVVLGLLVAQHASKLLIQDL